MLWALPVLSLVGCPISKRCGWVAGFRGAGRLGCCIRAAEWLGGGVAIWLRGYAAVAGLPVGFITGQLNSMTCYIIVDYILPDYVILNVI